MLLDVLNRRFVILGTLFMPQDFYIVVVLALTAACELLASACHVAVAYDFNFAAYDSASLYTAVQQGSPWLALASGGAQHMGNAGTSFDDALTDLDAAIAALKAETDPQDNDVIRRGPGDVSIAQLDSLHTYVGHVQSSMNTGFSLTADWNSDGLKTPLTIRLGQFFANPIPDWKAEVPGYTASLIRRARSVQYMYDGGSDNASANAPGTIYYSYSYYFNVTGHGTPSTYGYGDAFLQSAVAQVMDDHYAEVAALPKWTGDYNGYANVNGYAAAGGPITVVVNWSHSYLLAASEVFVPVIHWNAATFGEWVWPDPTFHGLLPGIGSSAQLLSTFGIDAGNWTPDLELDWTGVGFSPARAQAVVRPGLARHDTPSRPVVTLRSRR